MSNIIAELLTVTKKINNYLGNATTAWDSTTSQTFTVPAGKRWFVLGGAINRDVSSTLTIYGKDSSDKTIYVFAIESATTGLVGWPKSTLYTAFEFPILDAGEKIVFTLGTAQGAAAFLSSVILEVDI